MNLLDDKSYNKLYNISTGSDAVFCCKPLILVRTFAAQLVVDLLQTFDVLWICVVQLVVQHSVREYVIYVFFRFQNEMTCQKE